MSTTPLTYERTPPAGNALIDSDPGSVYIRRLPDRTLGHISGWIAAACGISILGYVGSHTQWNAVGLFRALPLTSLGLLFFVLAGALRYKAPRAMTTIVATRESLEFTAGGLPPRVIPRDRLKRVFTRDTPMSKRLSLGLRLTDGADVILGTGDAKEIEAMARALHRVLNSTEPKGGQADAD